MQNQNWPHTQINSHYRKHMNKCRKKGLINRSDFVRPLFKKYLRQIKTTRKAEWIIITQHSRCIFFLKKPSLTHTCDSMPPSVTAPYILFTHSCFLTFLLLIEAANNLFLFVRECFCFTRGEIFLDTPQGFCFPLLQEVTP